MFAMNVFGPALKYRLDLLKHASHDIKDKIVILTDRVSFDKFYCESHHDYNFIFVEDYMSKYELSVKHEVIPNVFIDEEDHFTNSNSFYSSRNNFFSFDIHRFVFEYFIDKGIKKFVIIDSDTNIKNDIELVDKFFDSIPDKTIFGPAMGTDLHLEVKNRFWNNFKFDWLSDGINLETEVPLFDGWLRGFNFEKIDDARKFFDLWNTSYLSLLEERFNPMIYIGKNGEGPLIWSNEWIFSNCAAIFKKYLSYDVNYQIASQPGLIHINNTGILIAKHTPRPEDNLFHNLQKYVDDNGLERYPSRGAWYDYRFNYDGKKTIANFISRNKEELVRYYKNNNYDVLATDTHIYTRLI